MAFCQRFPHFRLSENALFIEFYIPYSLYICFRISAFVTTDLISALFPSKIRRLIKILKRSSPLASPLISPFISPIFLPLPEVVQIPVQEVSTHNITNSFPDYFLTSVCYFNKSEQPYTELPYPLLTVLLPGLSDFFMNISFISHDIKR